MRPGLVVGEGVETPAGRPEQEEVVVAQAEERGVEGAVHGRAVAGVVHRPQAEERVVDLAPREVRRTAVHPIRDAGLAQRVFERLEARCGAVQHGDVAPPRRARPLVPARRVALVHLPAPRVVADQTDEEPGDGARLVAARGLRRARLTSVGRPEQDGDPRPFGVQTVRLDPLVARLAACLLLRVEEVGEDVVDPPGDGRGGAEVLTDDLEPPRAAGLRRDQPWTSS